MGYLAGADAERIDEFNQALADPETTAILPIRGGYGAARIIDQIDYTSMANRPKLLCGFSDITAIHAAMHRYAGVATFHGPNLQDGIGRAERLPLSVAASYWRALKGPTTDDTPAPTTTFAKATTLVAGSCEGPLVGGNLAVLCGLIGTPFEPDTSGAILLLEDIGEVPYRIDRMLAQLRLAGKFESLVGVLLGHFTDFTTSGSSADANQQMDELWQRYFAHLGVPVLANYPIGHTTCNMTVPLGVPIRMQATAGSVDIDTAYAAMQAGRDTSIYRT